MTDIDFMREALAESRAAAAAGEVPVGAVAVLDGRIIARAGNQIERDRDASSHAEMLVLRRCAEIFGDWRMDRITLYVTKEPCPMCAGMLVNSHLKQVVFGMSDPKGGGCGSGPLNIADNPELLWRVEVHGGVLEEECLAVFREFFAQVRSGRKKRPGASA